MQFPQMLSETSLKHFKVNLALALKKMGFLGVTLIRPASNKAWGLLADRLIADTAISFYTF